MFLSGPFEVARVLVEKDNASFDLRHEIQGPLNEWIEARFKLVQEKGEKIWLEAVTSKGSTLGKTTENFLLFFVLQTKAQYAE